MSVTAHTKGPWTVHTSRTTDDVGIIGDNGCLAECFSEIRKAGEKAFTEQMANARLISAAPDMLAALQELHADCISRADKNGVVPIGRSAFMMIEAAIAKATGVTP